MSSIRHYKNITLVIDHLNKTLDVRMCRLDKDNIERIAGENQEGLQLYRQLIREGYTDINRKV